ncbi:hypothetical protein Tco_0873335 [Tanacetum coccineum]
MSTLTQDVLAVGFENRPSMLEKGSYDTWQSRMLMYIEGKENAGRVEVKRMQTKGDWTTDEKKQMECDITAANIIFQGLLNEIYNLLNHMKTAHSIWYRVKKLREGVKQSKYIHTVSYDQLYAYLKQNQDDANEIQVEHAIRNQDPLTLVANTHNPPQSNQVLYPPQHSYDVPFIQQQEIETPTSLDLVLEILTFNPTDDPIKSLNKDMMFLNKAFTMKF